MVGDDEGDNQPGQLYSQSLPTYLATRSFFGLRPHTDCIHSPAVRRHHPHHQQQEGGTFENMPEMTSSKLVDEMSSSSPRAGTGVGSVRYSKDPDTITKTCDINRMYDGEWISSTSTSVGKGDENGSEPLRSVQHATDTVGYNNGDDTTTALSCQKDSDNNTTHHCTMTPTIEESGEENLDLDMGGAWSSSTSSPCSVISQEESMQVQVEDSNNLIFGKSDSNSELDEDSEFQTPRSEFPEKGERYLARSLRDSNVVLMAGDKVGEEKRDGGEMMNLEQTKQADDRQPEAMKTQQQQQQQQQRQSSSRRLLTKRKSDVLFQLEDIKEAQIMAATSRQSSVRVDDVRDGDDVKLRLVSDDKKDSENDDDGVVDDGRKESDSNGGAFPFSMTYQKDAGVVGEDTPCTPSGPKARKIEHGDPYHIFEVNNDPCLILKVRVLRGRNITLGYQDYCDIPDPYLHLHLPSSPEGTKYTSIKMDNSNPVWNEDFTFFIAHTNDILEIRLMEWNLIWCDQHVGTHFFHLDNIREMGNVQRETFVYERGCEIDLEFYLESDKNPTLRYSLCLSDAEKSFQEARKRRVMEGIRSLLGHEDGPRNIDEVPTVAVIGSGGGFRAMTSYSGVFKALVETGVLDCVSYAGGLSGSAWFLSTLYSHPNWPNLNMEDFLEEMMNNVDKHLLRFLKPVTMVKYFQYMYQKRTEGQPVSFTDIFGRMVGETLLPKRMDSTLSSQREKIKDGKCPMPLYTCVHVKKDVPAKSFQEWVEFSPYEIGMPKYGTFMDSSLFGSKFFMGKLVKQYEEQPLHFLQGIWGSAFCILFKRLLSDNRRIDPAEIIRQEMGENLDELQNESSSDCSDDDADDDDDDANDESGSSNTSSVDSNEMNNDTVKTSTDNADSGSGGGVGGGSVDSASDESMDSQCALSEGDSAYEVDNGEDSDGEDVPPQQLSSGRKSSLQMMKAKRKKAKQREDGKPADTGDSKTLKGIVRMESSSCQSLNQSDGLRKSVQWGHCPARKAPSERRTNYARSSSSMRRSKSGSVGFLKRVMKSVAESENVLLSYVNTRQGRAAVIHNFMRGLSLQQTYPLSPFTPLQDRVQEGDEFDGIFEMHPTTVKHIYMVDAGLTFNSPYPLVLRPQREVDIILSFDFSARPSDNHEPFKELKLAAKWAELNRLPFPKIDLSEYERDGMKELYVFRDPNDALCPIVLHFVLVNKTFRYYSKPGVPRQTKEEFDFAEFDIFDDPDAPYSTFNFTYTNKSFQRLTKLTEFNTLLHVEEIKKVIRESVLNRRKNPGRYNFNPGNTFLLNSMNSVNRRLHKRMGGNRGSTTPTPDTAPGENSFVPGYNRELSVDSSVDGSVYETPREYFQAAPEFSASGIPINANNNRNLKRPPSLSPSGFGSNGVHRNSQSTSPSFAPTSPSSSLPYGTPPTSNIHFGTPPTSNIHFGTPPSANIPFGTPPSANIPFGTPPSSSASFGNSPRTKSPFPNPISSHDSFGFKFSHDSISESSPHTHLQHPDDDSNTPQPQLSHIFRSNAMPPSSSSPSPLSFPSHVSTPIGNVSNPHSSSHHSTPSSDQPTNHHQEKSKTRNVFFPKVSRGNSSSSPSSTGTPNSGMQQFQNAVMKQMKKTRQKNIRHPNPLRLAHVTDKLILDKHNRKWEAAKARDMLTSSPRAMPPVQPTPNPKPDTNPSQPPQRIISQTSSEDNYTLAPAAFQSDGTPVFDSQRAKMYYDEVKSKRKLMFRRQSTVSTLNSMSLDEINECYFDAVDDQNASKSFHNKSPSNDSGYNSILSARCPDTASSSNSTAPFKIWKQHAHSSKDVTNFEDLSDFKAAVDDESRPSTDDAQGRNLDGSRPI